MLLQVTGQLVHLLTEPDLLSVAFIHHGLLLKLQFLFELLVPQLHQL